ncbi:GPP34 family phosphoprotein [Arthrobacter sp. HS15c]|uniref:GOLPH3/VPS74 family protein n=1 Tax=Arthrobacter sp. HS15c TaxID=3230279 RepID=UPI00346651E6
MSAEKPEAGELSLPQAFLLLATNDKDGEPDVPQAVLKAGLAGAILAELDLLGAIELQGKHVRATGAAPQTDFQHQLELIREKSRPHTPKRWVSMLESRAELHRVYEGMASLGIVDHVGERHLGLFKTTRYPEKNHAPEAALLEKISAALGGSAAGQGTADGGMSPSGATDRRITALVGLLYSAELLGKVFPGADQGRARELAHEHWASRAVADELRMIRLAEAEAAT